MLRIRTASGAEYLFEPSQKRLKCLWGIVPLYVSDIDPVMCGQRPRIIGIKCADEWSGFSLHPTEIVAISGSFKVITENSVYSFTARNGALHTSFGFIDDCIVTGIHNLVPGERVRVKFKKSEKEIREFITSPIVAITP